MGASGIGTLILVAGSRECPNLDWIFGKRNCRVIANGTYDINPN
jgi:hypothetical protein